MNRFFRENVSFFLTGKIVWDIKYNLSTRETGVTFPVLAETFGLALEKFVAYSWPLSQPLAFY